MLEMVLKIVFSVLIVVFYIGVAHFVVTKCLRRPKCDSSEGPSGGIE